MFIKTVVANRETYSHFPLYANVLVCLYIWKKLIISSSWSIIMHNYGCIFLVSLYYLRKWFRGMGGGGHLLEGGAYLTLWHRGRALIWGRVLITAWVLIWGNTVAYHCYRIKPIILLFCAINTILFTEKGPWHFSNISTSMCRTYLNAEVIDRQCVYRNNFHLQNNSASYKFSLWETFSGVQYSDVRTKWWTYKYWWATESHSCRFVLGCCVFFL